eukprot:COSAG06_NODE_40433_length_402_cov_0.679868_1_plen_81_part_10
MVVLSRQARDKHGKLTQKNATVLCIYAGIIVIFFALSSFAFVFATFSDMVQEARDKQEARAVARHAAAADAAAQEEEEKEA